MEPTESEVIAGDGVPLFVRQYAGKRASGVPRRSLLLIHGACEHGGRYPHVCARFAEAGWDVVVPDHRGHGRSGGPRTHVTDFSTYVDDLERVVRHTNLNSASAAVLGHSMGGLLAAHFASKHSDWISAAVMTAPLFGTNFEIHPAVVMAGRLLTYTWPTVRFNNRIDPSMMSRDETVLELRRQDPLLQKSVSAAWYFAMRQATEQAFAFADTFHTPLLMIRADRDEVVSRQAAGDWFAKVASEDRALIDLPDHLHEVLNEPDWLDPRVGQ